jgi:hypothetical protein
MTVAVLFSDKVFIEPVTDDNVENAAEIEPKRAYACSTWKQTRSSDASSSSGRLRMKRLVIQLDMNPLNGMRW